MNNERKVRRLAKELGIENIADTIKIGSKEEAAWKQIFDNAVSTIAESRRTIELTEIVRDHAEKRMSEEHEKFLQNN